MIKEKLESTHHKADSNPYHPFGLKSGDWLPREYENVIEQIKEIFDSHPENRVVLLHGDPVSGKTGILKRIAQYPSVIGKNYIPIYVNSREFAILNAEELLLNAARHVIVKLYENESASSMRTYIENISQIKYLPLDEAFLKIDLSLENKNILILLVYDFDNLLENFGAKNISTYIKLLESLQIERHNYGLIMVGSNLLAHHTGSTKIDQFLDSVAKIDLEKVLKKENIRNLITEPVKGKLTYEEEAINKILWYSGKNLHFQQLICYYIVEYLKEKGTNRCFPEDVINVVSRIKNDDRDEFRETWEKKFSIEFKLIASALADKSVTEGISNIFSIKENKLLETALGGKTSEIIEKLYDLGYINRIHGRRFDDYPFQIPLFGMWIGEHHPFINTLVGNIEALADKIDLNTLIEEIDKALVDKLNLFDKESIWETAKKWHSLKSSIMQKRKAPAKGTVEGFLESLANLLKIGSKPIWQDADNYFKLNIKSLNIGILEEASCFIQGGLEITENEILNLERIATPEPHEKTNTKLAVLFYFQKSDKVEELTQKNHLNLIALDEKYLLVVLFSKNPAETLRKTTLNRLSLQSISPYQTEGPARATFYGRSDVIKRIIVSHNASFSIVGARKIGKSSLLHKIKDDPPQNSKYIFHSLELEFHDVKDGKNYTKLLKNLEEEIKEEFKKKVSFRKFPLGRSIDKLPGVIKALPTRGKKIIFIFDEIDVLLEFDKARGYKLMHIFRAMSEKNYCQFIFAGFMKLYLTKHDYKNPMYNFGQEEILDQLEKEAALDLVTKPMIKIGVSYKNPEVRDTILEYTGRHPNLIQFFCKKLVEKVDKHPRIEDRRTIFKTDIAEVFDTKYQDYIMNDVYGFFSELSNINRLILILLTEEEKKYFSLNEIHDSLLDCGISILLNHVPPKLKELVVRFILIEEETKYRFAIPVFPHILRKRIDKYFKEKTIDEIKKEIKSNA
jgi:hypothetical protein